MTGKVVDRGMNESAILLAAGLGQRYGESKQDVLFHGKPLWRHAYDTLCAVVDPARVVTVGKDIPGGATRTLSVRAGLEALPGDTGRVIIVESARPMVTSAQIREILDDTHPSATFVRPLVNAVIFRDGRPLDRNALWDILTPQAFDYGMLLEAYRSGRYSEMIDDTAIMDAYYGIRPHFIQAGNNLYKVTYPGDLHVIEGIYQTQREAGTR